MHCKLCNTTKDSSSFYASNKTRCKECVKARVHAHRQENLERIRSYDRMRGSMPHRVAARAEYRKTESGKLALARARKAYKNRSPERRSAHVALGNAVRDGRVIPWPTCAVPDCCGRPQAHHPDYSRPLDVVWLCDMHHKEVHAMARKVA
jgi:hypothetical protein